MRQFSDGNSNESFLIKKIPQESPPCKSSKTGNFEKLIPWRSHTKYRDDPTVFTKILFYFLKIMPPRKLLLWYDFLGLLSFSDSWPCKGFLPGTFLGLLSFSDSWSCKGFFLQKLFLIFYYFLSRTFFPWGIFIGFSYFFNIVFRIISVS